MLTFVCKSNEGDGSGDVRCLRSCVNQMKETEAETDTDANFGLLLDGHWPGDVFIQKGKSVANLKWRTLI